MNQSLCIIHANCQGEELEQLLLASPSFRSRYKIERYTNYIKEPIPRESLENCQLFLYQRLGEGWGERSSDLLLQKISSSALSLELPNLFFTGYWPFWTNDSPIDFGDSFLNRLIDEGAPKQVILKLYLHKDITQFHDFSASFDACIEREREKEKTACVATVDWILANWKKQQVFHTVNHPGAALLLRVANKVFDALGMPPVTDADLKRFGKDFPSYSDFDLPVHPQVSAFYGLSFGGPQQTYPVFGKQLTFEQYISRYIDCRLNGFEDSFQGYLQLV